MWTSSYLSPKCDIRSTTRGGKGVFAIERIEPEELVAIWLAPLYTRQEVQEISRTDPDFEPRTVTIHEGFHQGSSQLGEQYAGADYFNHSCDPNVGVKGQIVLLARRLIEPNEELCFDYDTTEITPPPPHFHCQCGSPLCRGVIDGTSWQNPDFIRRNRDWLSWNVMEHIRKHTIQQADTNHESP